jgi:uncharacterized membrane protein
VDTVLQSFIIAVLVIGIYFAPFFIAKSRGCKRSDGVAAVNLFLGWTFIGWVVALAWAASGETNPKSPPAARRVTG